MGKRKNMVTLEDLIEEVGVDATRYWMIIRSIDTTLDFDIELAKSKSKDGSAQNGGDVGWIARGQVVPEFADAAFKLNKGQYTQTPVKTQFGYHVIYVEDKKPTTTLALKDVKGQIEQNLRLMKFQENVKKEGQELRKKAKVEITAK